MKKSHRWSIWFLLAVQMLAWIWFQTKGGQLNDTSFYIFCFCMLCGQSATCAEALMGKEKNWGTFASQALFFVTTVFGGFQRWLG